MVLGLELRPRFVDDGALVGEKRGVVVARTLHDRPAFVLDSEQSGDECAQVGGELDQQLRDGDITEIRALALPVIGIGFVQISVGTAEPRVEGTQQFLQSLGAEQIAVAEPFYAKGKIP